MVTVPVTLSPVPVLVNVPRMLSEALCVTPGTEVTGGVTTGLDVAWIASSFLPFVGAFKNAWFIANF